MQRIRPLIVPLTLITLGVILLIGCIPIPATRLLQADGRTRPEYLVGRSPNKPVQLGVTHIDEAFEEISKHLSPFGSGPLQLSAMTPRMQYSPKWSINRWFVSVDHRQFRALYGVRTATWLMPLCFSISAETAPRWLILDVDENGVVIAAKTTIGQEWRLDADEWLEIFDDATREKLVKKGVFPTDQELRAVGQRRRSFNSPEPASQP